MDSQIEQIRQVEPNNTVIDEEFKFLLPQLDEKTYDTNTDPADLVYPNNNYIVTESASPVIDALTGAEYRIAIDTALSGTGANIKKALKTYILKLESVYSGL